MQFKGDVEIDDFDLKEQFEEWLEEWLAGGGYLDSQETDPDLLRRLDSIERELKEINFWKADRNHSHKGGETSEGD